MSCISRLDISSVRNIASALMEPSSGVNLLYGENGSGKTSVLESIHLLASGRSFRSSKLDPLIRHGDEEAVVYAELSGGQHIGLSKSRRKNHQLRYQNENQKNWETVARELPGQVLDSNSFLLLEGGPKSRRRFLDWGVFHVEPNFVSSWRNSRKAIANRNHLLKQSRLDVDQLEAWDRELCIFAEEVDELRKAYFHDFNSAFRKVYESLGGTQIEELVLTYQRGWDFDRTLDEILAVGRQTDIRYGATQNGPHRADVDVMLGKSRAVDIFSRGQQKILVSAMKIAQGVLLSDALDRKCIYLVDDLPSELDFENRSSVFAELLSLGAQLFITTVEVDNVLDCISSPLDMTKFHVEHGIIRT
ncbi:MAG: DNA replication/repair protein RecF [Gammaproteobacteria bacterium]|nr:DNA replication/repair protein RecF [Gammaproteobacteria bacterium]